MPDTTTNTERVSIWEDLDVIAYQCKAKGGMFMQSIKPGLGAPEGITLDAINAELDKPGGLYVAFPIKGGGFVVRKRRGAVAPSASFGS